MATTPKTFSLSKDNQFIHTNIIDERDRYDNIIVAIYVSEYNDDPNSFAIAEDEGRGKASRWSPTPLARISNDPSQQEASWSHQALEVNGVTLQGDQLTELFNDLTIVREHDREKRNKTHLLVNRQGLCFVDVGGAQIRKLRVNDYFGWSKYGVKLVPHNKEAWKRLDMHTGKEVDGGGSHHWWNPWS
ncbi:hypothetical protein LINGRAHAP2_LOCUS33853 [Linum grandiflorum]